MPHPLRLRQAITRPGPQLRAARHIYRFQLPWQPERSLVADDAEQIAQLLRSWSGPDFPYAEVATRYRQHAQIPGVIHSALEYYRWAMRSQLRPDGLRFARAIATPSGASTLQIHGLLDPVLLPATARDVGKLGGKHYELVELEGVGHFPAEERPAQITQLIHEWASHSP
jgi:pimeloyl-ACP methyl ester carboxylesterase